MGFFGKGKKNKQEEQPYMQERFGESDNFLQQPNYPSAENRNVEQQEMDAESDSLSRAESNNQGGIWNTPESGFGNTPEQSYEDTFEVEEDTFFSTIEAGQHHTKPLQEEEFKPTVDSPFNQENTHTSSGDMDFFSTATQQQANTGAEQFFSNPNADGDVANTPTNSTTTATNEPNNPNKPNKPKGNIPFSKLLLSLFTVVIIGSSVVIVMQLGDKKEKVETAAIPTQQEVVNFETDIGVDDVSGVLTMEKRNEGRTFKTFTDTYLNLSLNVPSDYYLTEKTHLDLDIISKATGNKASALTLETHLLKGVVQVMELKNKSYSDYTMYLQVNHSSDYPVVGENVQKNDFKSITEKYFLANKLVSATKVIPKPPSEDILEEGLPVNEQKEEPKPEAKPAPTGSTTKPEIKVVDKEDGTKTTTYIVTVDGKKQKTTMSEGYVEGGNYKRTINYPNKRVIEYTEQLMEHGVLVTSTKEFSQGKLISTDELHRIPFYLASVALDNYTQVRDYSVPDACYQEINALLEGVAYDSAKPEVNEALSIEDQIMTKQTQQKKEKVVVEPFSTRLKSYQEGICKEQIVAVPDNTVAVEKETQLNTTPVNEVAPADTVQEQTSELSDIVVPELDVEAMYETSQSAQTVEELDLQEEKESTNRGDQTETFLDSLHYATKEIGGNTVKVKRVDLRSISNQQMYEAYEYAFVVGGNEFYLTVVGKRTEELQYVLEDAEQLIASMVFSKS